MANVAALGRWSSRVLPPDLHQTAGNRQWVATRSMANRRDAPPAIGVTIRTLSPGRGQGEGELTPATPHLARLRLGRGRKKRPGSPHESRAASLQSMRTSRLIAAAGASMLARRREMFEALIR